MFYTYCPTLMLEIPQKTVDTLISLGRWQSFLQIRLLHTFKLDFFPTKGN